MMQLMDLPEEIIIMILKKLDFYSLLSIYNTSSRFRNLVCLVGVVTECNMSMNYMATVKTLRLDFFEDISNHLLKLNMCGVPGLYKTKVLPAFKKLKCLKTLDISYTNLNMNNLLEIYSACPSLKDITINFSFGQPAAVHMSNEILLQCQSVFEHFENVHFVGSISKLLFCKLVLYILNKTRLHTLKLSVVELDYLHGIIPMEPYSDCQIPHFDHFAAYIINWKTTNTYECFNKIPILSMINLNCYEFIIVSAFNMKAISVQATPMFKKFFSENYNVTVECHTDNNRDLMGNIAIMIWNKETTHFDELFFHKLNDRLKQYFPFVYNSHSGVPAPQKYDWIYIEPKAEVKPNLTGEDDYQKFKKRRRNAMPTLELNYDNEFKDKHKVQLSCVFNSEVIAAAELKVNFSYLRKLTYLSLSGAYSYTSNFFNVLFRCCDNLVTLTVESPAISPCLSSIGCSIGLSPSLKNIRIVEKCINFSSAFLALSECQTLENIHLIDHRQWEHSQIADPSILLDRCRRLYSVFIVAPFAETALVKQLQLFNIARVKKANVILKVVIKNACSQPFRYTYHPYEDVFKLNPIKPI